MSKKDWYNLGNDIKDIVQSAVDSQDFDKLNQTISNVVNGALKGMEAGLRGAGMAMDGRMGNGVPNGKEGAPRENRPAPRRSSELFANTTRSNVLGTVFMAVGYSCSAVTGFLLLLFVIGMLVGGVFYGAAGVLGLFLVLFAGSVVMAWKGTSIYSLAKRYKQYIRGLRGRTYANVEQLAREAGKTADFVKKDLERMISRGWFLEGHLDRHGTCFMVTNEVYEEYLAAERRSEELRRQQLEAERKAEESGISPEVRAVIEEGNAYIKKIRQSNDAIPGVEISEKISRIELIVQRIFERVEQHPENIPDIRRMMEYYLPTTVKLLGAYEELDHQPVQGENILASRREIEDTLDTLNLAFEKLLDGLFKDTAWDVSTDISVLNTMLAQEGLTKDDF